MHCQLYPHLTALKYSRKSFAVTKWSTKLAKLFHCETKAMYGISSKWQKITSLECTELSEYASTYIDSVTGNQPCHFFRKWRQKSQTSKHFYCKTKAIASYVVGIFYYNFNYILTPYHYILIPYHILIPQYNSNSFYLIKMCDIPNKNSLAVKKGAAKQSRIKTWQQGLISDSG